MLHFNKRIILNKAVTRINIANRQCLSSPSFKPLSSSSLTTTLNNRLSPPPLLSIQQQQYIRYFSSNSNNNNNNNSKSATTSVSNKKKGEAKKIDDITSLDNESVEALIKFDKTTKKNPLFPANNEVLIYPTVGVYFTGTVGSISLSNKFIDRLVPNTSGHLFIGLFLIKDEYKHLITPVSGPLTQMNRQYVHNVGVLAQISITSQMGAQFIVRQRIEMVPETKSGSQPFFKIKEFGTADELSSINDLISTPSHLPIPPQVESSNAGIVNETDSTTIPTATTIEEQSGGSDKRAKKEYQAAELIKQISKQAQNYTRNYPGVFTSNGMEYTSLQALEGQPELFLSSIINMFVLNYPTKCQKILETPGIVERLQLVHDLLQQEEPLLAEQSKIYQKFEDEMEKNEGKLFLNEQLKLIKKQLGVEYDEKEQTVQKYWKKLSNLNVPDGPKKVIEDEINKLSTIDPSSLEYNSSRNYLDWLTNLPWQTYTPEFFDLKYSKEVLDRDHYGLTDIKQRILEFISIGHIKGSVQGKIICFVGPPGTGKTSIAKSIASCLKREFYRFSVGGLFDEGEIKGHRRTYIGSMPGKLIQCMKLVKSSNPVILIDEIDKIGKRNLGDPSSALLEVLDPEQNVSFIDHYLDVPYDLSRVLFICTANSDQTIPGPLFDRMEVIYLSGYVEEEQIQIVTNFVIPKTMVDCGIKPEQLTIDSEVVKMLVKFYSREVGIRELERLIERIMRKAALKIVNGQESVHVTTENIEDYLGIPTYSSDRYYDVTPVGVVNGLAWSARGGSTLYIETIVEKSKKQQQQQQGTENDSGTTIIDGDKTTEPTESKEGGSGGGFAPRLRTTGKLGDVMTESTNIAYTFAKNFLSKIDPDNHFFENHSLHMHVPQGGTPKDGPSAGVTMVTSLLSLALNEPVVNNLGMTGEVTITGKVLTIGGVKEKTIAAKRSGLTSIIVPSNNKIDYEELPDYIKKDINVMFASDYKDVFKIAFPKFGNLIN